jgi:hypothetical protein
MNPHPTPIIILSPSGELLRTRPSAGATYTKRVGRPLPAPKKSRLPRRPQQQIPTFDRRAARERVVQLLKDSRAQRDGLKAASLSCWALQ